MDDSHPRILDFQCIRDPRGNLSVVHGARDIPFAIARVFYIFDVPEGAERGGHAHYDTQEVLIAAEGSFDVTVDDGHTARRYTLNRGDQGLYIPAGHWRMMDQFAPHTVCLVLASTAYSAADYIYEYTEYLDYVRSGKMSGKK